MLEESQCDVVIFEFVCVPFGFAPRTRTSVLLDEQMIAVCRGMLIRANEVN